jgi:hypothetical protein
MILTVNRNNVPVIIPYIFFTESDGNAYINELKSAIKCIAEHSEITFTLNPPALIKVSWATAECIKNLKTSPERKAVNLFKGAYQFSGKRLSGMIVTSIAERNFIVKTDSVLLPAFLFSASLLELCFFSYSGPFIINISGLFDKC